MVTLFDQPIVCPIIVGRDAALATLGRWLDRARSGAGQTALIAGEAGIGKSRLVAEARSRGRRQGYLVLQGRCFEPDRALPYAPIIDLLQTHLAGCSPDEIARDLTANAPLARLLPDISPRPPDSSHAPSIEPDQEKRLLNLAFTRFITDLAARQPLLVVVEDLHWCDDAGLDLIIYLARRIANHPILLLLTYRSDEIQPALAHLLAELDHDRLAAEIRLDRLPPADVDAMVRAIFAVGRPIRADFLDVLATLTDGNPFFVEETLKSLVAAGDIFYADGAWNRKELAVLQIPRSVQDAVHRRAARVGEPARQALALAAVAGRRFDFGLIQDLLAIDEDALLDIVKELIAAQLVVEESADRFAFRHALTRQAIYAGLLARERQTLHRRVAEAIEQRAGAAAELHAADLAIHYTEAGVWDKALPYGRRAGERALTMHSPRAAAYHLTRALTAAEAIGLPPLPDLYRLRGQAFETIGEFDLARTDLETALVASRTLRDRRQEWQALLDLGFLWASRDYDRTGVYFRDVLALAHDLDDPAALAHSLNRVGNWHLNSGRPHEAKRHHQEALTTFEALNDRHAIAETLDLLGMAAGHAGDPRQGRAHYERAVALYRELGDRRGLVSGLGMLAELGAPDHPILPATGLNADLGAAFRHGEEAVAIAREIGWRAGEAFALLSLSYCLGAGGVAGRALTTARQSLVIAEEIAHDQWQAAANLSLGTTYGELAVFPLAIQYLERGLNLAREVGSAYFADQIALALAWFRLQAGDLAGAERALDEAARAATPSPITTWMTLRVRTDLALARGDAAFALDLANRLIANAATWAGESTIPSLWLPRAQALAAHGRPADAEAAFDAAHTAAERGAGWLLRWRIALARGTFYRNQGRQSEAQSAFTAARAILDDFATTIPDEPVAEIGGISLRVHVLAHATAQLPAARPLTELRAAKQMYDGLTSRERDVAAQIARGKSNRVIADELVVSERTVTTHITNILAKLGFSSRSQIAVWATEKGLTGRHAGSLADPSDT